MKTIGIKLADGSFYPILEEGTPRQTTLDLTTVNDNQTTVQVDLYRSETGSMKDAEYVDTMQIDNLVKHPNGEPDLSLTINLDENNKLSAEINDPESGAHSNITVTLVSRTLEERSNPTNFEINMPEDEGTTDTDRAIKPEELENLETDESVPPENAKTENEPVQEESENTKLNDTEFTDTLSFAQNEMEQPTEEVPPTSEQDSTPISETQETPAETEIDKNQGINETNFELPDFDESEFSATDTVSPEEIAYEEGNSSVPNFENDDKTSDFTINDLNFPETNIQEQPQKSDSPNSGEEKNTEDANTVISEKKKTSVPAIVCIICAIICIIATILVLFVVPSRLNLLNSGNEKKAPEIVQIQPESAPNPEPEPPPVEKTEPEPPQAEKNKIVVSEPAKVIPTAPESAAPKKKPAAIRYKIKWGDTLWDLADAYYRNPWLYHKIAKYNKIKDPDYIISGTYITIPEK